MTYVMPDGFLRLYRGKSGTVALSMRFLTSLVRRRELMPEHLMRDIGLMDGHLTPGGGKERYDHDTWSVVRDPPRYL